MVAGHIQYITSADLSTLCLLSLFLHAGFNQETEKELFVEQD
jgi:hypothetical protein